MSDLNCIKMWVDPPQGWKYNFPKIYDVIKDGPDVYEWIIKEGYPRKLAESYKNHFCYRMWEVKDD
jgi:hypothetical protein